MQTRFSLLIAVGLASLVSLPLMARDHVFSVQGTVRAPLDNTGHVTIAHDDIPGLMPAMTMSFAVADPARAASLTPGDRVRFQLDTAGADWTVGSFTIVGHTVIPPSTPAVSAANRRLREGDLLPAFSCLTEENQPITAASIRGRVTLITFIFTRCPVPEYCPAMALRFAQLQKAILATPGSVGQTRLLSITLDPEFDRPDILKAYGEAVGANPAVWQFATGEKETIAALTKSFAVYTERNGVTLDHTLCTALIGPDGRILQLWRGNGWKIDEVLAAFAAALRG
jgi:protein SCO1/2